MHVPWRGLSRAAGDSLRGKNLFAGAVIERGIARQRAAQSPAPALVAQRIFRFTSAARNAGYVINIEALSPEQASYEADRTWVGRLWEALLPHASGAGGYVNFTADTDAARVRASYGDAKYRRLARIKAEYAPTTSFG
ncbi:MAG TPA: BBE domain-containing protein [Burkholderiaceae bacterium]|nr:BBE domain-containing protein [Burkholderiaceae bacterium]